jgi:signal transduction histidine kinase
MSASSTRDRQIVAEQVRTLYAQLPVSVPTQIVGGALLVAAMWNQVSRPTLVAWFAVACVNQLARLALYRAWQRRARPDADIERWRLWWASGAGLSGLIWGSAGVAMFVPDSPTHQAVLIVALLGVATGSITVIATDVAAFYAFASAVVVPVLLRTAWESGATYAVLAAIGAVVLAAILACGRNLSKELARSLAVYYQNLDLIEELQAQKAIAERARHEAEAANRAKTQFFASASHDLRQPLHAMGLFTQALSEKARDPEVRQVADSINISVQALEALFSELLDIAKIDSGSMNPVLGPFALDEMFGRLRRRLRDRGRRKGLAPDGGRRLARRRERSRAPRTHHPQPPLQRDPLHDAGHGAADGGVGGAGIRIEVSDTGLGIREEDRQRIFEEFFQLGNPARTSAKGMGLGLSIVQRLCGLLGYELTLASEYGAARPSALPSRAVPPRPVREACGAAPPHRSLGTAGRCDRRRGSDRRGHARAAHRLGRARDRLAHR